MENYQEKVERILKVIDDEECSRVDEGMIPVYHHRLALVTVSSGWKRECPFCSKGLFLVRRDPDTYRLEEFDNCIYCGQRVKYIDIEAMRERDGLE